MQEVFWPIYGGPLVDARVPLADAETGDTLDNAGDHPANICYPSHDAEDPLADIEAIWQIQKRGEPLADIRRPPGQRRRSSRWGAL